MSKRRRVSRRGFLRTAAGAAVGFPLVLRPSSLGLNGAVSPSNRITMGAIGVGGRGTGDMKSFMGFPEVQVLAVCDVVRRHRQNAKGLVDGHYGNQDCDSYVDFREITRRDDIDTVLIGTPDHWHAIPAIDACEHGKDVFCEKPLSLTVREGRAMVEAARRYGRVFSGGSQRVFGDYGRAARYVHDGALGRVYEAWVNVGGPSRPCDLPGEPVPDGMEWDTWLGPAPWAPYHPHRCSKAYGLGGKGWRTWRDYSGGMMTDWGGHKFGGALYALGLDHTGPVEIIPPNGTDAKELTYVFADGTRIYRSGKFRDIGYRGALGTAPGPDQPPPAPPKSMRTYKGQGGLGGDFLYCVKTRELPFRDVEIAHRTCTVCHLGNIAYELGRPLKWDPQKEAFPGDAEANRMLDRPKREPWRV